MHAIASSLSYATLSTAKVHRDARGLDEVQKPSPAQPAAPANVMVYPAMSANQLLSAFSMEFVPSPSLLVQSLCPTLFANIALPRLVDVA
jgi:hypothetical protein